DVDMVLFQQRHQVQAVQHRASGGKVRLGLTFGFLRLSLTLPGRFTLELTLYRLTMQRYRGYPTLLHRLLELGIAELFDRIPATADEVPDDDCEKQYR